MLYNNNACYKVTIHAYYNAEISHIRVDRCFIISFPLFILSIYLLNIHIAIKNLLYGMKKADHAIFICVCIDTP